MTANVGTIDRVLRVVAGLVLIACALGLFGPAYTSPWGWAGLVLLATAAVGQCGLYRVFGITTCPRA